MCVLHPIFHTPHSRYAPQLNDAMDGGLFAYTVEERLALREKESQQRFVKPWRELTQVERRAVDAAM